MRTGSDDDLAELRALRPRLEAGLLDLPNVIGSMLGAGIRSGAVTDELTLTLFVSRKAAIGDLGEGERIPPVVSVDGRDVRTDVLTFEGLRRHSNDLFPGSPLTVSDGTEDATLTAFARSRYGLFGMTCAHAIEGADGDPYTRSPVWVWSPKEGKRLPVGFSTLALAGGGGGAPGAFGFCDVALFSLDEPSLQERAKTNAEIPLAPAKIGLPVVGHATSGKASGQIVGLDQVVGPHRVDVWIKVASPGLWVGDSGMLWRYPHGAAVALHAKGSISPPGVGSAFSAAMDIRRATQGLKVDLVET